MAIAFTVKLPDGNEYGPVDLATLRSWHEEGRIGADTWVWPEGSPEWLTVIDVLAGAGQEAPGAEAPLRLKEEPKVHSAAKTRTAARPPSDPAPAPKRAFGTLAALLAAFVAGLLVLGYFVLLPRLDQDRNRRTMGDAVPERRYLDPASGVSVDLPEGWVLLKPDSTLFTAPQAAARFAHPETGAFAALAVESIPPGVLTLDAAIDRAVDLRRALFTDYRERSRADAKAAERPARRLLASWKEGGGEQRVAVLALQDAWSYSTLAAWCLAKEGSGDQAMDALLGGLRRSGALEARVAEAVAALQPELPELSPASLALIVRDRLGSGGSTSEVADASTRAVSQGLPALSAEEAGELRQVYAQVYEPVPEAQRQRLAAWQRELRAGRQARPEEAGELRPLLRDALVALPDEARARLQTLNEKAIAAAYALR